MTIEEFIKKWLGYKDKEYTEHFKDEMREDISSFLENKSSDVKHPEITDKYNPNIWGNRTTYDSEGNILYHPKQPDFTCPHSGESFKLGEECWIVNNNRTDIFPCFEVISERDIKGYFEGLAYFHSKEKAIEWDRNKFGGKDI